MKLAERFPEWRKDQERAISQAYIHEHLTLEEFEDELDRLLGLGEWAYS